MEDKPNFDLQFSHFVHTSKEDQLNILDKKDCKNTKQATGNGLRALNKYLTVRFNKTLDDFPNDELPEILYDFYTDLRKKDGDYYKLQSL